MQQNTPETLKEELKELIITSLNLPDMKPSDIDEKSALFGTENNGLGLDSVDALELGLAIQKRYGLKLDSKQGNLKEIFYSIDTLSRYIAEQDK
ncbi:phosphopantetheine-binding protein [Helicobacter sp. T3_23-1056]